MAAGHVPGPVQIEAPLGLLLPDEDGLQSDGCERGPAGHESQADEQAPDKLDDPDDSGNEMTGLETRRRKSGRRLVDPARAKAPTGAEAKKHVSAVRYQHERQGQTQDK